MGQSPFRVPVPPLDCPTRRPDPPPVKSPRPSTASTRKPHSEKGRPQPNPVPLSGFPNLSAVSSKHAFHGMFQPQPFLIAPFRAFPSQRSRTPLGAAGSLAVIHRRLATRRCRPYHLRFPRRPRPKAQLPGSPEDYGSPFDEPKPASRSPWASSDGTVTSRRLHPLRSFLPSESPFAPAPSEPGPNGRCSLGLVFPFRDPLRTSEPRTRPVPRIWARAIARRLQRTTPGTAAPGTR